MRVSGPVVGCPDPLALAEFYERLLGWPVVEREGADDPGEEPWAKIRSAEAGLKIEFQYEPHFTPPVWPPVPGEQQMLIHLDIGVPDLEEGVAWAVDAGATEAAHQPQADVRVMLDPAGHPFCLFADPLAPPV
jgi:catechol 2,3-dioxygenase-like lactoylglutathione lyase family enzyme